VNKTDKIIIIFYIFLGSSFGLYVLSYDAGLDESLLEVVTPKKITEFETSRLADIAQTRIFDIMADVENFPNVLPENIVSVNILSKTDNEIIAEEELFEAGIKVKLLVKHTIKPYSEHIIEIIDGDAEGTTITQYYESMDCENPLNDCSNPYSHIIQFPQTKITTNVDLKVKGVTSVVAFVPEDQLSHAINTVTSLFIDYSKYGTYEKMVDSIYREILFRPADREGILHFSPLLESGQITEQDIRSFLLNSEEKAYLEMKSDLKTIDELNEETINIISDLYRKILLREVDPGGLQLFGTLFERGITLDEIRTMLLESDEAKSISFTHPTRTKIITVYKLIFDGAPDDSYVDYYQEMSDDGVILFPDWIDNVLLWGQINKISHDEVSNSIIFLYNEGVILPDERSSNEELVEYKN